MNVILNKYRSVSDEYILRTLDSWSTSINRHTQCKNWMISLPLKIYVKQSKSSKNDHLKNLEACQNAKNGSLGDSTFAKIDFT